MSLTTTDLQAIRAIVQEENLALERDVKEIYRMLVKMQRGLTAVARHVGIALQL